MSISMRSAARRGLAVLPAITLLMAAAPVVAQPSEETIVTAHDQAAGTTTRQLRVPIAGLNMSDPRDQDRFARRVAAAANHVCADEPGTIWNKFSASDYTRCYSAAVATAMSRTPVGAQPASN